MTTEVDINRFTQRLNMVEGKMDDVERHFRVIIERTDETTRGLVRLEDKLDQQAKGFETQLIVLDVGLKQLARRVDALESRVGALETRIGALEARVEALEARVEALEARIGALEARIGALEARFDAFETRFDAFETKFDALSIEISRIATHLGIGGAPRPVA